MGRRLCKTDNNHPNNIFIDAIKPHEHDGKLPVGSVVALNCLHALTIRTLRQLINAMYLL